MFSIIILLMFVPCTFGDDEELKLATIMASKMKAEALVLLSSLDDDSTLEAIFHCMSNSDQNVAAIQQNPNLSFIPKDFVFLMDKNNVFKLNSPRTNDKFFLLPYDSNAIDELELRLDSDVYLYDDQMNIYEVYAVKKEPMELPFGSWNGRDLEQLGHDHKWDRRTNLNGTHLSVSHLPFFPLSGIHENNTIYGYLPDIWETLTHKLNLTYTVSAPPDGKWGGELPNGSFTGMIGQAERGEIDIAVAALSRTAARIYKADFTRTTYIDTNTLISKQQSTPSLNVFVYFESLTLSSWWVIFGTIICLSIVLAIIAKLSRDKLHGLDDPENFGILNGFALVWILLWQRDYRISTHYVPSRVLFFTSAIFAFLIFSNYSAMLTSTMISRPVDVVIETLDDFLETGQGIVVWKDTAAHDIFRYAKPGSQYYRVFKKLIENNPKALGETQDEMIELLMSQENTMSYDTIITYYGMTNVSVVKGFRTVYDLPYAFSLPRDSEFTSMFNYHMLQIEQSGVTRKLLQKWDLKDPNGIAPLPEPAQALALGYDNLFFPFLFLCIGVASSILGTILEKISLRMSPFRGHSNKNMIMSLKQDKANSNFRHGMFDTFY